MIIDYSTFRIIRESMENLSDDIIMLDKETLEPIDPKEWEIDTIVDVILDPKDIEKYENAGTNVSMDLTIKSVDVGQILWLTALLKPRNKSIAYSIGEMGVIKVKVMSTYYGLNKLSQLKSAGKL
jgi:hypothetical protein